MNPYPLLILLAAVILFIAFRYWGRSRPEEPPSDQAPGFWEPEEPLMLDEDGNPIDEVEVSEEELAAEAEGKTDGETEGKRDRGKEKSK